MISGASLLSRLDARDRALFARWAISATASRTRRRAWATLTHLGGATCTVTASLLPIAGGGALRHAALQATATLVLSHLVVQLVKRTVGRPRPSRRVSCVALIGEPDRFSFPSGHAAAAMSIAYAYAAAFPALAVPLVAAATVIGMSRVCLGVHYPGDVVIGQAIAVAAGVVVAAA